MLIQRFINTLPNRKDRINQDFDDDYSQLRFRSKRAEEGRKFSKQMC